MTLLGDALQRSLRLCVVGRDRTGLLVLRELHLELQRDRAMVKDPFFDYGQALLQIAIVLASVAIITGGTILLVLSALLAALGSLSTLNGFFLFTTGALF